MSCRRCYGRGKLFMGPEAVLVTCPDCKGSGVAPESDVPHAEAYDEHGYWVRRPDGGLHYHAYDPAIEDEDD